MSFLTDGLILKVLLAVSIFVVTLVAGWYPFKLQRVEGKSHDFPVGESLACGIFLGAGLLHLLVDAEKQFVALNFHYPMATLITGSTFLLLLYLEHIGRETYHHKRKPEPMFIWIALIMFSVHSLLEGAALGISLELSLVVVLFAAVIGHKWADGFAVAVYLNKSNFSRLTRNISFIAFSLMTPVGILFGSYLSSHLTRHELLESVFSAMTAGTFLYFGTLHGLDKGVMVKQCCNLKNFRYVILGFLIMALIAVLE
jgi:zinc transporter ZupT